MVNIVLEALSEKLNRVKTEIYLLEKELSYEPHIEFCKLQIRLGRILKKYGGLSPVTQAFANKYVSYEDKLRKDMKKRLKADRLKQYDELNELKIKQSDLELEISRIIFKNR